MKILNYIPKILYIVLGLVTLYLLGHLLYVVTDNLILTFTMSGIYYILLIIIGYIHYETQPRRGY